MSEGCRAIFDRRKIRRCWFVIAAPCEHPPHANCLSDNTNADIEVRKKWLELAAKRSVPIRCIHFTAAAEVCEHNDVVRALNKSVRDFIIHSISSPNEVLCIPSSA